MAEDTAKPIPLLITEDIEKTLSQVRVEQDYHVTLTVERLNEENHEFNRPRHLLAVIDPGDPEQQSETNVGFDRFLRTYVIHVWVLPSQTDDKPIDEYCDYIAADVIRNLCDVASRSNQRGGYAEDTMPGDTVVATVDVANSLAYLVNVPVVVQYETVTRNLYRQN